MGVCSIFRISKNDNRNFKVELRDVAVGAALLLNDQNPVDYGFEAFRELADPKLSLREKLRVTCFAFATPSVREAAHKQAGDDGREVRLVVTSASVLRIFAITGFDQVISRFSRLDQALAAP